MFATRYVLVKESYEHLDCGQQALWNRWDSVLHGSSFAKRSTPKVAKTAI
jgi:hypothetical protein